MQTYELLVGNVGVVFTGEDGTMAHAEYNTWAWKSEIGEGRAAGEPVTLLLDGEVVKDYAPVTMGGNDE